MSVQRVALAAVTGSLALYLQGCGGAGAADLLSGCADVEITNGRISPSGRVACNDGFAYSGKGVKCFNTGIRMCPSSMDDGGPVKDGNNLMGDASDCVDMPVHVMEDFNGETKPSYLGKDVDHGGMFNVYSRKEALRAGGRKITERKENIIKQTVSCSPAGVTVPPAAVTVPPVAATVAPMVGSTPAPTQARVITGAAPVKLFDSPGGDTLLGNHLGSFAAAVALMGFITLVVVRRRRTDTSRREIDVESELEKVLDGEE